MSEPNQSALDFSGHATDLNLVLDDIKRIHGNSLQFIALRGLMHHDTREETPSQERLQPATSERGANRRLWAEWVCWEIQQAGGVAQYDNVTRVLRSGWTKHGLPEILEKHGWVLTLAEVKDEKGVWRLHKGFVWLRTAHQAVEFQSMKAREG